jgi:hypothetical protein
MVGFWECGSLRRQSPVVAVHPTVDAVRMIEAIQGWRDPVRLEHNTHPSRNV